MKRCPQCHRVESDDALKFCRVDGATLVASAAVDFESATITLPERSIEQRATEPICGIPSIAVLPFVNLSADPENEYFCDGLAEELLNALAKIGNLKVAARTSAFSFKGKRTDVRQIGQMLNVSAVLEGSVRKAGNRLRITAQLVNVADGYHLWSERYDRELQDIFNVQDEITLMVVDALKVKLLGEEKALVLKHYTDNTEAYESYLRGLHHFNKWTADGWLKSVEYFERAIEKEPAYAPAYAMMGDCYRWLSHVGALSPQEVISRWKAATNRALALDSQVAEAHLALAHIHFYYEWNWAEADEEFKRAIELNPNSVYAHQYYGLFLATQKRFDEAMTEGKRALELDPLSPHVNFIVGAIYFFVDHLDDALNQIQRMIDLEPNFHAAYWLAGDVYQARGEFERAVEAFQKAIALGSTQQTLSHLGCAYGLAGRQGDALGMLNALLELRERQYAAAFNIARIYAGLGDREQAFEWLAKAVEERNGELVYLDRFSNAGTKESWGKDFHTDARYHGILRRVGFSADQVR